MKFTSIAAIALVALVASTDALPKGKMFAPGCDKFHTVSNSDTCTSVCSKNHITLTDLFAWNHGLHPNCNNLDDGTKVCVGGPKTGKTSKPKSKASKPKPKKKGKSSKPKKH
ncbi:hypothetical protein BC937DRAFT_91648 [Endogone sp. FLAS-F59071]|nr:hypothetical protein BC937DRAFT_91648 [Endogone sp. FLAS-F59071]|eukprot:RUS16056.1 hypothetical protein BC937DRAFT_91648 [Endogone sp. FLAS-F59071]